VRCDFESLCGYLSKSLDDPKRIEVAAHLRECDICMDAVIMMRQDQKLSNAQILLSGDPGRAWGHNGDVNGRSRHHSFC